ncbi:MAG: 50S ribosomal protein L6 [Alphaproteobacteria bacterium CG_4_10_14_0_8_um_filter_53_9]|nr:MAG: 50S ribosomal protein L6 [Alphaproteobacteria bacterium CG_4_10_14_0_8_um_filter_53_9]
MSRVGKKVITVPSGVDVQVSGQQVNVKGAKGNLSQVIHGDIKPVLNGTELSFVPVRDDRKLSAIWGTSRALVSNMIEGVTNGYKIGLKLVGVGYRANMQGANLNLALGYSHPVNVDIPQGIAVEVSKDQTEITITGSDKQQVGEFAAFVRGKRPPEPFKGKGVKYVGEFIAMKEGKKK